MNLISLNTMKNKKSFTRKIDGIDVRSVKPIVKKRAKGVKDPVRFPGVINAYENESKRIFNKEMNLMFSDMVKKLVSVVKKI